MANLALQKKMTDVRDLLLSQQDQIQMALPRHVDADRLLRIAITAIRKTPRLLECSPVSLLGAVIQSAQLGLEPDGLLGQAYLVPYKREVTLIIGYRGMIDLARRSGQVVSISARIVHEGDFFEYEYGLNEKLEHRPSLDGHGEPLYAYAVAQLKDGGYAMEVLSLADIKKARAASRAQSGPWQTHWAEMARKTAVRKLFKYLPVSVELQRAVSLDEYGDQGIPQHLDILADPDAEIDVLEVKSAEAADELAENLSDSPPIICNGETR